eukprot:jgi/Mesen1/3354/ME000191S02497
MPVKSTHVVQRGRKRLWRAGILVAFLIILKLSLRSSVVPSPEKHAKLPERTGQGDFRATRTRGDGTLRNHAADADDSADDKEEHDSQIEVGDEARAGRVRLEGGRGSLQGGVGIDEGEETERARPETQNEVGIESQDGRAGLQEGRDIMEGTVDSEGTAETEVATIDHSKSTTVNPTLNSEGVEEEITSAPDEETALFSGGSGGGDFASRRDLSTRSGGEDLTSGEDAERLTGAAAVAKEEEEKEEEEGAMGGLSGSLQDGRRSQSTRSAREQEVEAGGEGEGEGGGKALTDSGSIFTSGSDYLEDLPEERQRGRRERSRVAGGGRGASRSRGPGGSRGAGGSRGSGNSRGAGGTGVREEEEEMDEEVDEERVLRAENNESAESAEIEGRVQSAESDESAGGGAAETSSLRCALEEAWLLNRTLVVPDRVCMHERHNIQLLQPGVSSSSSSNNNSSTGAGTMALADLYDLDGMDEQVPYGVVSNGSREWGSALTKHRPVRAPAAATWRDLRDLPRFRRARIIHRDAGNFWLTLCWKRFPGGKKLMADPPFAKPLRECAAQMARRMGPFDFVHVRRGDKIKIVERKKLRWPHLDRDTRPENIRRRIARWVPDGSAVYVASNEQRPGFFDPLKEWYKVWVAKDFEDILGTAVVNNYHLFAVELMLAEYARNFIGSFKGESPQGYFLCHDPREGFKRTQKPVYDFAEDKAA